MMSFPVGPCPLLPYSDLSLVSGPPQIHRGVVRLLVGGKSPVIFAAQRAAIYGLRSVKTAAQQSSHGLMAIDCFPSSPQLRNAT